MQIGRWQLAAGCAAAIVMSLLAPSAWADGQVVLGGGAGIVVEGGYCTLGTIGRDKTGELVGFTAGHCGGPGAQVVAEGSGVPSRALFQPGDDGGPVTSNDLLIGLVYGGNSTPANVGMPQIDFTRYTKFSAIQDDVNAKDGPGAGFSPIVA